MSASTQARPVDRPRRSARAARGAAWLVGVAACVLHGCAGAGETAASSDETRPNVLQLGESGLQVRRWRVADPGPALADTLAELEAGAALDDADAARLERNGFLIVRLPVKAVPALLETLGGPTLDLDGWHGQAPDWRAIAERRLDGVATAFAVDRRVRRLAAGRLRLMLRGWTLLMEDGPFVHVELRPELDRSRPTRFDQVLQRPAFEGERFASLAVELLLAPGYAYVVTGLAPEPEAGAGLGPEVFTPPTLGETLFERPGEIPQRELLVLVPRVPETLFPPDLLAAEPAS